MLNSLNKFITIQEQYYPIALNEIRAGKKKTHWMWFIFPQIDGLGYSAISKKYAIKDINEAKEYLNNDILRSHLMEISEALLKLNTNDPLFVMGYPDNFKLQSSMTLFLRVVNNNYNEINNLNKCSTVFKKVLDKYFDGLEDKRTIDILNEKK